jgi:hypothetical protein
VFTAVGALTRHLFNPADDQLLSYLNEEGQKIEPEWWGAALQRPAPCLTPCTSACAQAGAEGRRQCIRPGIGSAPRPLRR